MMDWSSSDCTVNYGDNIYVPPQDHDAGIYLDEGYDPLGRRQRDRVMPGNKELRAPPGRYNPPEYVQSADSTHWSRAESKHAEQFVGKPQRQEMPRQMPPRPHLQNWWDTRKSEPWGEKEMRNGGIGIHLSDRAALQPIYDVEYDERPARYNPNTGNAWANLVPGMAYPAVPAQCAAAYPNLPTPGIPSPYTQSWAQNVPWSARVPTAPCAKEGFAGAVGKSDEDADEKKSSGKEIFGITVTQLQLLFLFIIVIILSLILRSMEKRNMFAMEMMHTRPLVEYGQ